MWAGYGLAVQCDRHLNACMGLMVFFRVLAVYVSVLLKLVAHVVSYMREREVIWFQFVSIISCNSELSTASPGKQLGFEG